MPITKERLAEIDKAMNARNNASLLKESLRSDIYLVLADYVPELFNEVLRLQGCDGEPWRIGEHCACRFKPDGKLQLGMCELHIKIVKENLELEKERNALKSWKTEAEAVLFKAGGNSMDLASKAIDLQQENETLRADLAAAKKLLTGGNG